MEDLSICKDHGNPIQLICETCNKSICYECVKNHLIKGCQKITDLPTYGKDQLIPKFKSEIEDFEKQQLVIETSIDKFLSLSTGILTELTQLKVKMETLLMNINESIDIIKTEQLNPKRCTDYLKNNIIKKYETLIDSITNKDMEHLIDNINFKSESSFIKSEGNEETLIKNIKETSFILEKSKDIEALNNFLKEFIERYKELICVRFPEINNKYIYNATCPQNDCKVLCRYDIVEKKITNLGLEIPKYCTISQIGKRIFLSGGYNPYINSLSEYLDESKTLAIKSPMKYVKYDHTIEGISSDRFVAIGGNPDIYIAYCEEYSIKENKWFEFPSLNIPRSRCATTLVKGTFLYAIGGYNSESKIEVININLRESWEIMKILANELNLTNNPESFPISDNEIIIMRGDNTTDLGVLHLKKLTIRKLPDLSKPDYYVFNTKCLIKGDMYSIGYNGHIHIYHFYSNSFEEIDYSWAYP